MRAKKFNHTRKAQYRISHQTAAGNTVVTATAGTLAAIQAKARKTRAPYMIEQLHLGELDFDEYMSRAPKRPHWNKIYTAQPERAGRLPNPRTSRGIGFTDGKKLRGASASKIEQLTEAWIKRAGYLGASIAHERAEYRAGLQDAVHSYQQARERNAGTARTPNPAIPRSTRPLVTDRALRYRAQRNPPAGPELCAYCGASGGRVDIDHVDGHEENGEPENLAYACRPCNTAKGIAFREEGIGRPTRQFNPQPTAAEIRAELDRLYQQLDRIMESGKEGDKPIAARIKQLEKEYFKAKRTKNPRRPASAGTLAQWKATVTSLMGLGPWTPAAAVGTVQRTPQAKRAAFARQLARRRTTNPGADSSGAYFSAIQIMRGNHPGDAAAARALIDATPASDRSQWTRAAWRTRKEVYGPSGRQGRFSEVPF